MVLILLIIIPSSFAHENDTQMMIDEENSNTIENVNEDSTVLQAGSNDYYFNASAADDSGDGTINNPYKYLTADRIKANANIYLANGEYKLDQEKTIEQVNFIGSDVDRTVIQFDGIAFKVWNSLTLKNLTLKDASIMNFVKLNATNTIFSGGNGGSNIDSYGNHFGGAIYCGYYSDSYTPTVNIKNCTFLDNYAEYAGAIYMDGGSLDIVDTMFINNFAYNFGGAIAGEYGTKVSISGSKFFNSYSMADAGGAIYLRDSSLKLNNVEIFNSSATFGGAITTLNTDFSSNHLNIYNSSAKWDGGAIYHMYGNFSSIYGNFVNNSARNGGGLFIDNSTNLVLIQNKFENNKASLAAGAIYSLCSINKGYPIQRSIFKNNSALVYNNEYIQSSINITIGNGNYTMYKNNASEITHIPSSYDLRNYNLVTSPKDQQASGNCWAFTAISVLESAILKASGQYLDLSEENMKNVMAQFSDYGWKIETNDGGYDAMQTGYFAGWLGPVYDSDDVFDDHGTLSPLFNSVMHVQNIVFLKRNDYLDNDAIKKAIMQYGAVGTSMLYDNNFFKWDGYYCWYYGSSNHAVTIVGWDDNYSRDHFYGLPQDKGDGAWIVRNSWGPNWNGDGYFYVSYYDEKLAQPGVDNVAYAIILNDTIKYDKNYQYDIAGKTDFFYTDSNSVWYKNIFKSETEEYLAAVSTYFEKIANWTASVYVNGELKALREGLSNPGYYTFDLGQLIHLNKGDVFEVIFNITGFDPLSFPISEKVSLNKMIYEPGISYFSLDGKNWIDLFNQTSEYGTHKYSSQVACIKAFTILNKINTVTSLSIVNDSEDSFNLTAVVVDEYGNLVNNGNVTFKLGKNEYVVDVIGGIAELTQIIRKTTDISATFNAVGYNSSVNSTKLTVPTIKTSVDLDLIISQYQNKVNITVSASENIDCPIIVVINNETYSVNLTDGKYAFNNTFANGFYNISVALDENPFYEGNVAKNFTVDVSNTLIESNDLVVVDEIPIFSISLKDDSGNPVSSRTIEFTLNNASYSNVTDINGTAYFVMNLPLGEYNISVNFKGDEKYFNSSRNNTITVKTRVSIDLEEITVDKHSAVINVTLSKDINENISFKINDDYYYNMSQAGKASFALDNLDSGNYDVEISLKDANKFYVVDIETGSFMIKKDSKIEILPVGQHYVGDSFEINVLNNTQVNVTINNESYEVKDGKIDINTSQLAAGEYVVVADAKENDEFLSNSSEIRFNIVRKSSIIESVVVPNEVIDGQNVTITVKMAGDEYGDVLIIINDFNFTAPIENHTAHLNVNLPINNYHYIIKYLENDKFNESMILSGDFDVVEKLIPNIIITNNNTIKSDEILNLTVKSQNITGDAIILMDGKQISNISITDDLINISFDKLSVGTHYIELIYLGNDFYKPARVNSTVTVNKLDSFINAEYNPVNESETLSIIVEVQNDAKGIVLVNVGGKKAYGDIESGKATVNVDGLTAGNYTANIIFIGDDKYNQAYATIDVGVKSKEKPDNKITVIVDGEEFVGEVVNGTVVVDTNKSMPEMPSIIIVDGVEYSVEYVNGTAVVTTNPVEHDENITIIIDGVNYTIPAVNGTSIKTNMSDELEKAKQNITDLVGELSEAKDNASRLSDELEMANKTISDLSGQLDDAKINATKLAEDLAEAKANASRLTDDLANAEKNISDLSGQLDDAKANVARLSDELDKANQGISDLAGELSDAIANVARLVGELEVANKTISDLSGQLDDAKINATKLAEDLAEAKSNASRLSEGLAEANAKVNNLTSELANAQDNATKLVEELSDAKANVAKLMGELEEAKANITDLSGQLDDAKANVARLSDELDKANQNISDLTGKLDDTRDNATKLADELVDANKTIDDLNRLLEEALANKTKSVVVGGREYPIVYVDGTATVTTDSVEPVKLIGTKIEADYSFTRQANDYVVGERGEFFYAVLKDINDKPLANMTCYVAVNGPIYTVTTDDQGRFGVRVNLAEANTYTYALSFLGNDKYSASFNSTKLIMTAKKTSIVAKAKSYKVKAKKTFSVTLKTVKNPYDGKTYLKAGKKITLTVNGKTYTAKTNSKGVAKFTLKLTKKGKYTAKIKFAGDKTYKASSKSVKITIK